MGGSAGAGGVSTSSSLRSVIKRQLAGGWWALVIPFSSQPAPGLSHTPPQPLISHLPPGCWRQDVNQTLWTFNFVLSCKLESTQQYPPSWNLPDPSPGPSSCQPLKCLPSGRPLDPAYPSFGLLPLCRSLAGSGLGLLASLHPLNLPWRGGTWQARPSACSGFVLFGN